MNPATFLHDWIVPTFEAVAPVVVTVGTPILLSLIKRDLNVKIGSASDVILDRAANTLAGAAIAGAAHIDDPKTAALAIKAAISAGVGAIMTKHSDQVAALGETTDDVTHRVMGAIGKLAATAPEAPVAAIETAAAYMGRPATPAYNPPKPPPTMPSRDIRSV